MTTDPFKFTDSGSTIDAQYTYDLDSNRLTRGNALHSALSESYT